MQIPLWKEIQYEVSVIFAAKLEQLNWYPIVLTLNTLNCFEYHKRCIHI